MSLLRVQATVVALVALGLFAFTPGAESAPLVFDGALSGPTQSDWESAVGTISGTENFNNLFNGNADISFNPPNSVAANNMTLTAPGATPNPLYLSRNMIDVAPFFAGGAGAIDDTPYVFGASCSGAFPCHNPHDLSQPVTVSIAFDQAVRAWGGQLKYLGNGARIPLLNLYDSGDSLLYQIVVASESAEFERFLGFVFNDASAVSRIEFTMQNEANFGENPFGLDNVQFAFASQVPEPALLSLLIVALAGTRSLRRRR